MIRQLLLFALVLPALVLANEFVDTIATGGGLYECRVNGQVVSRHVQEHKASSQALDLKFQNPDASVICEQRKTIVGILTAAGRALVENADAAIVVVEPQTSTLYWEADYETGDMSQYNSGATGSMSVESDGEAYEGTYYASRVLANGSANDYGTYHNYGTAGNLSTQIRDFCAQVRTSMDSFTGSWPTDGQKIFIYQFYDHTWDSGSFSNSNRKYQVILKADGQGGDAGEYTIGLLEWDNEGAGTLVKSADVNQSSTTYGPDDSFGPRAPLPFVSS